MVGINAKEIYRFEVRIWKRFLWKALVRSDFVIRDFFDRDGRNNRKRSFHRRFSWMSSEKLQFSGGKRPFSRKPRLTSGSNLSLSREPNILFSLWMHTEILLSLDVVINHSFWCFITSKDELWSTFEAPLKYRHCNFLLIRFIHFKFCANIYLFRSSQRGCTYL